MSPFVLCVVCGTALYGFSPCRWCTCERCGNDLLNGFCSLCNSRNSCVYDPKPNSFDCPPNSYQPPHPIYETYSGDSCRNDSHLGYNCPPEFLLNYEPEAAYIQNYTYYPHDSPSFPQQYLCCDNCEGPHETFQCQPMNQDFCNSNSFGFDQSQPPHSPVIHPPHQETSIKTLDDQENKINSDRVFEIKNAFGNKRYKPEDLQELFRKLFNDVQNIHEELAEYIDTPGWNRPAFDDDDDDVDYIIAITLVLFTEEPVDSLSMGDEHLDTTPETEPDKIIKSGVEELVPILNKNEVTLEDKECDVPVSENSPICDDHFEIFSDSNNDDDISIDDDSFENIEYVEASLSDPETVSVVEENVVYQEEEYSKLENPNELFQKLLGDLKELAEYENSQSRDRPIFFNNDEDHSDQNKECFEKSSVEIATSNSNEEKEEPPQDSDIHQLIEECSTEEVKNVVEQPAERGNHIENSLQNFRVIHKNSISFKYTSQISSIHAVAPILSTKEPEYSPSMGYENSNITMETKSDEIIKFGVEELVSILTENEVTLEDKRECDMLVCEDSSTSNVFDNHSDIFSDSKIDDDISSNDDDFEDVEYVEESLSDPEIVNQEEKNLLSITRLIANIKSLNENPTPDCVLNSFISFPISEESDNSLSDNSSPEFKTCCDHTKETRSSNTTTHANNSLLEYDSFCFKIDPDQERLINVVKSNISDDSSNDPLLEEADLFLAFDNSIPLGIENVANDSEGDIYFLEELLIDDSILSHESSDSNFEDNLSVRLPPLEPPDAEFNAGKEIPVVMNDKDEDVDYSSFIFVIFAKVFSFLSAESEDTIFDPGIFA
uniref:Pre-mRNA splicing Prp18-interacting factor n=1 Tax=Tanacetum cinerariifolium TaxID=118510 RepID=A0A6L2J9Z9_TANCI|nr:hypothetical protein [Tanacetum cinerariifolium]